MAEPRIAAADIDAEAHGGVQPALPVEGVLDAEVERLAVMAGEPRHFPEEAEGVAALQMEPIEASHVRFEGRGTPQRLHLLGPQLDEFLGANLLEALRKHRNPLDQATAAMGLLAPGLCHVIDEGGRSPVHRAASLIVRSPCRMRRSDLDRTRWLTPVFRTAVRFRSAPLQGAAMVSTGHEEGD